MELLAQSHFFPHEEPKSLQGGCYTVPRTAGKPFFSVAQRMGHGVKFLGVEGVSPSDFEDRL